MNMYNTIDQAYQMGFRKGFEFAATDKQYDFVKAPELKVGDVITYGVCTKEIVITKTDVANDVIFGIYIDDGMPSILDNKSVIRTDRHIELDFLRKE